MVLGFDELHKMDKAQWLFLMACVLYLVTNPTMSQNAADMIDTTYGKIILVLLAGILFAYSHPILGILGIYFVYHLMHKSAVITGTDALARYYPTEEKKWSPFAPIHQFPYTLEQEMVQKLTSQRFNTNYVKAPYRPVLEDTGNAAYL